MGGLSSPRSVYVPATPFECEQMFILILFSGPRGAFQLAITAVPSRSEFYRRISQGETQEKLDRELAKWLKGLDQIVVHMKRFLEEGGYGTV